MLEISCYTNPDGPICYLVFNIINFIHLLLIGGTIFGKGFTKEIIILDRQKIDVEH